MRRDFTYKEALRISDLLMKNGYEVEYNDVAGFYIKKVNGKYSEIIPLEYGYSGFRIDVKRAINLTLDEAIEYNSELNKDVELLKLIDYTN